MSTDLSPQAIANRHGILAMTGSMACFVVNDAMVKLVSETMPAAQLICIRGLLATLWLILVAHALGLLRAMGQADTSLRQSLKNPAVLWRSGLDALATFSYLNALFHLPLGNATAIVMASPLFLTLYAVMRWREHVDLRGWLLILIGFVGVLLVVQPASDGFNAWALLCLLSTLLHTARDLVTRGIPASIPSALVTLCTAVSVTVVAAAWATIDGWQPVNWGQFGLLAGASVFLSGGYYLLIVGVRGGDMSVVSPFRYSGLLFALVLGWLVWADVPNALAWGGILLLVGAGVLMLRRQR